MVKRSTWEGSFTVYRFGTPGGIDLDEAGLEQLRLAHDLRNTLVGIEHAYAADLTSTCVSPALSWPTSDATDGR